MVEPHMASIGKLLKWDDVDTGGVAIEQVNESRVLSICLMMKARFTLMKGQNENQGKKTNQFRKMHETMQKMMLLSFSWCKSCLDKLLFHVSAGKLVQCWLKQGSATCKNAQVWILSSKESRKEAHSTSKAWAVWCLMISGQVPIIRLTWN